MNTLTKTLKNYANRKVRNKLIKRIVPKGGFPQKSLITISSSRSIYSFILSELIPIPGDLLMWVGCRGERVTNYDKAQVVSFQLPGDNNAVAVAFFFVS